MYAVNPRKQNTCSGVPRQRVD